MTIWRSTVRVRLTRIWREIIESGLYLPYIEGRLKSTAAAKPEAQRTAPCVRMCITTTRRSRFATPIRAAMAPQQCASDHLSDLEQRAAQSGR